MVKKFLLSSLFLSSIFAFVSCDKDEPVYDEKPTEKQVVGVYVLNQGTQGYNIPGSLTYVDYKTRTAQQDVFKNANGTVLGSTPQCGITYGSHIYIGDSQSNFIRVINAKTYKEEKMISLVDATENSPRSMVAHDGKIYVSMFTGHVCRLDTASLAIEAAVKVGPNPETMAIRGNYLYVPNSDGMNWQVGYGTTASKINLSSFAVEKTFEVGLNPTVFASNGKDLFLLCMGNYFDVPAQVYRVKSDDSIEAIAEATLIAMGDDELFFINAPYGTPEPMCYKYEFDEKAPERILKDIMVEAPAAIKYDVKNERLLITSNVVDKGTGYVDYSLPGYINIYDDDEDLLFTAKTGVSPNCIFL